MRGKLIVVLAAIAACGIIPMTASAHGATCRAIMTTPGYRDGYTNTIDVHVSRYLGMKCARALRVGAAAYLTTRPVARFGFGSHSFHVGHLYCWLDGRGSDFSVGACWAGHGRSREYVKFYDHRNY